MIEMKSKIDNRVKGPVAYVDKSISKLSGSDMSQTVIKYDLITCVRKSENKSLIAVMDREMLGDS